MHDIPLPSRRSRAWIAILTAAGTACLVRPSHACLVQVEPPPVAAAPAADVRQVALDAKPTAVTLYQGRAAVTREGVARLGPGIWEVRFAGLPPAVLADTLTATVPGPAKLLDVRFESRATATDASTDPATRALELELENLRAALETIASRQETAKRQLQLLDGIGARVSDGATKELVSGDLDPEKLKSQLAFIEAERSAAATKLLTLDRESKGLAQRIAAAESKRNALGGASRTERTGIVTIAVTEGSSAQPASIPIALTYLTRGATWQPVYAVRASSDLDNMTIDFDAAIIQRTGEEWAEVALTLSTAEPTRSAQPPDLRPIVVTAEPRERVAATKSALPPPAPPPPASESERASFGYAGEDGSNDEFLRAQAAGAAVDAMVVANATSATFRLPRTVTLPSDAEREQRTRIATIELSSDYRYVARPAIDDRVYLRGTVRNESGYQLLAGRASIFVGGDSIGSIMLSDVAPGDEMTLWFGADKRLSAERKLISKNSSTSGLISKSSETTWQYRIELTSSLEKPVAMEVWDRMPVSDDERIEVTLADVSPPLQKDAAYEMNERKAGLLKWLVTLPARPADRKPEIVPIRFTIKLVRPVDLHIEYPSGPWESASRP